MSLELECALCALSAWRTRVVPPSGDLSSPVVLVGEAPGESEDRLGAPFVGRAGKWLDKCMQEAGLDRRSVMITNTVKCRPPDNRRPDAQEIAACRRYLIDELRGRELIVALGSTAIEALLGSKVKVSEVANKTVKVDIEGIGKVDVLLTFHPSACIYNKEARSRLIDAMRIARDHLNVRRSASSGKGT